MSYVLLVLLTLLAIIKKEKKWVFLAVFVFLLLIYCGNYDNADYIAYFRIYEGERWAYDAADPISLFIFDIAKAVGLPFQGFFALWGIICLYLVASTIYRYSPYPALMMVAYAWWPFCIDMAQMRFFMAYSIVVFSLRFIIDYHLTKRKQNIWFFIVTMFIATGMHFSAIFFVIIGILFFDFDRFYKLITYIFPAVIVVGVALLPFVASFLAYIMHAEKIKKWISYRIPTVAYIAKLILLRGGIIFVCIAAFCIAYKMIILQKDKTESKDDDETADGKDKIKAALIDKCFMYFVYYGMLYMVFELLFNSVYERMMRFSYIVAYIFISRMIHRADKKNQNLLVLLFLAYMVGNVVICLLTYGASVGHPYYKFVFMREFNHNLIIPGF